MILSFSDEDFYESLVTILNKQHIDEEHSQLDMEAISRGDFGDVTKGTLYWSSDSTGSWVVGGPVC